MNPHRIAVAALFVFTVSGCSNTSDQLVAPSMEASKLEPGAPPIEQANMPRIRISSDTGWKYVQSEGEFTNRVIDLTIPEGQAVTFQWSALPKGQLVGMRWTLDSADIFDETPRINDEDLAHWSVWSATDLSATLGPFAAGETHFLYVEARNNVGLFSLVTVRLAVVPASEVDPAPTQAL